MQVKMLTMLYTMLEAAAAALSVLPTGDRFIQNLKDYGPGLTHASDPRIMDLSHVWIRSDRANTYRHLLSILKRALHPSLASDQHTST